MNTSRSTFSESKTATEVLSGVIAAVEAVLQTDAPESVKRALFDKACWIVSERFGKFKTRYRSEDAHASNNALIHEHVMPRAQLWCVVARKTMSVADAFVACEACVVTDEEHRRLHAIKETYGWERYAKAGIRVIDCASGEEIPTSRLLEMSAAFKKAIQEAKCMA